MKKFARMFLPAALLLVGMYLSSCKSKPKDADIKAAIETALKADPMSAGTTVSVEKGVATISGECKDEACKAHCEELVKGIKGVTSVVNNCTVTPPPPPVVITPDDPLIQSVADALKDFPSIKASVTDGVVTLTGEIAKADLKKVMMALSSLKPKKIDASALIKK